MPALKPLLKLHRYRLLLLAAGLLLLLAFDFLLQLDRQTFLYPDAGNYLESSRNLFVYHRGHQYRPMLMAFVNGLPYGFGGSDLSVLQWSLFVNAFCWLGSGLLVFGIVCGFTAEKKAFWLALSFFAFPGCAVLVYHLLAETIFMFCLLLALRLIQLHELNGRAGHLGWALAVLVAAMLVKPVALFLALGALLYFSGSVLRHFRRRAMLPLYGAIFLVVIQMAGLRHQFGNFTISYIDAVTMHNYLLSRARCEEAGVEYRQESNPRAEYFFTLSPSRQKEVAANDLRLQLRKNLPNVARAYIGNMMNNASHGSYAIKDCANEREKPYFDGIRDALYAFSIWQNRIMTPLCCLLALGMLATWRRRPDFVLFAAGTVLYIIVVSGISCGQGDRFFTPLYPTYLVLIAAFFWIRPSSGLLRTTSRPRI